MVHEYHYTKDHDELIYLSVITLNNSYETSLYIGKKLVRRYSFMRGVHLLKKDNVEVKIQIKFLSTKPQLKIDGKEVKLHKIRRKELRRILDNNGIYNDINPSKKEQPRRNPKSIFRSFIFIALGVLGLVLFNEGGKFIYMLSMLMLLIGGFMFTSPLVNIIPERHLNDEGKVKIKIVLGLFFMGFVEYIVNTLMK